MPFPHSYIKFTDAEVEIVKQELERYAVEGRFKKHTPLVILYLSHIGKNYQQISESTHPPLTIRTIRRWIYRFRKEGLKPFVHPDILPPPNRPEGGQNALKSV